MEIEIKFIIDQIWLVLHPHIKDFQIFGGVIVGILFAIEILDEAIDIAMGRGFQLDKKLFIYLFVAMFILGYVLVADKIWTSAVTTGSEIVKNYQKIKVTTDQAIKNAKDLDSLGTPGILKTLKALLRLPKAIMFAFATALIWFSILLLMIMIGGAYACLGFVIISGPLFIAFLISSHTKGLFLNWLQNLISYFILIPFLGWTMQISYNIFITCFNQFQMTGLGGTPEISSMFILLVGPILAIGITIQIPKIVSTLIGGAVSAGMAGASAVFGGAMMGMKMAGGSGGSSSGGSPGAGGNSGLVGGVTGKGSSSEGSNTGGVTGKP